MQIAKTKPETPIIAAGVLIVTRQQPRQFLLMRHADRWDLPKGHAEPGESPRQTAVREMTEETGFAASQVELDPDFEYTIEYPVRYSDGIERLKRVYYYLGWIDAARPVICTEHIDSRWFPWQPGTKIQAQTIDPLITAVAKISQAANW